MRIYVSPELFSPCDNMSKTIFGPARQRTHTHTQTCLGTQINGHIFFVFLLRVASIKTEPEHSINITSYIIRGAGNKTHYEYEIRIFLPDDRWLLLRRYSRFRELHLSMKAQYGDKVREEHRLKLNEYFNFYSSSA